MKYLSKIFQPLISNPKNAIVKSKEITSKSQKLLAELGLVKATKTSGCFTFLPLGMRSLEKLITLVDSKMSKIDAQKTMFPILASEDLWIKSGRLDTSEELMHMKDRHNRKYILCPELLYGFIVDSRGTIHRSHIFDISCADKTFANKVIPGSKFRDEKRPRYGIIRGREFLMKDLYTFDTSEETSKRTYSDVCDVYDELFNDIGVPYVKVEAATGMIGGILSHEYHYTASLGEDKLMECNNCGFKFSSELLPDILLNSDAPTPCIKCDSSKGYKTSLSLEVGHTFLLGTRYSEPFSATSTTNSPLHMGCYGLGLTRILGACLEALSTETELRWPPHLAPFTLCVVGPKKGSKEAAVGQPLMMKLCSQISKTCESLKNDSVIDDRNEMTIGKRVMEAKRIGYPFILVVGQKAVSEEPKFELIDVCNDKISLLNEEDVIYKLQESVTDILLPNRLKISEDLLTENSVK